MSSGEASPIKHRPDRPLPSRPRILIVLMGSLGDVVRGLSLPGAIKQHRPEAVITWLVEPACAELVAVHPHVDETIIFDRPQKIKGPWALYRNLSSRDFDVSLDLQRHFKSGVFSLLARAPRRIGFHRRQAKEFNWLFQTERLSSEAGPLPKLEQYQQFLDVLGLDRIRPLDFGLQGLAERTAGGGEYPVPLKTPYVALVLGSSWESKEWFFESYLQLMRRLLSLDGLQLVLLDVPGKKQEARALTEILGSKRICNLVGRTSLPELAGVLQGAELAIGPDCGSGHLAAAVGTAYITLFGPTAADRTAPYGCLPLVCEAALDCRPCYRRRCPRFDKACMRAIDPEAVFALACSLLGRSA